MVISITASRTTNVKIAADSVLRPAELSHQQAAKELIDKLLLEKLPLAGIAKVADVAELWLKGYVNRSTKWFPGKSRAGRKGRRLSVQCEEVWSFVESKGNKKWIRLALDTVTQEIVGVFVGSRSQGKAGVEDFWRSLPAAYRQCAVFYTDFWKAYAEVFPSRHHAVVDKGSGRMNRSKSFNCTLRQRTSWEGAALSKTAGIAACSRRVVVL